MTRTPTDANGKPLPRALVEQGVPEWVDEDTQPLARIPTNEELEAELEQHASDGMGLEHDFWRGPL